MECDWNEWESAPKHGGWIVAGWFDDPGVEMALVRWDEVEKAWEHMEGGYYVGFTHWCSLPAFPPIPEV